MANLLAHLKSDYYTSYKFDFVNNYINPGLQQGKNVPLVRLTLEAYSHLLPSFNKPPITASNLM